MRHLLSCIRGDVVREPLVVRLYYRYVPAQQVEQFVAQVRARYLPGTLVRLLGHAQPRVRRITLEAIRAAQFLSCAEAVVQRLHDEEPEIRRLAEATLWTLWFHAAGEGPAQELQQVRRLVAAREYRRALAAVNDLLARFPRFAEAYNQRAILFWEWGDYRRAILDCQQVLRLDPYHFGALAGMGQAFLALNRLTEALRAFRQAYAINPNLHDVRDCIRSIEKLLPNED